MLKNSEIIKVQQKVPNNIKKKEISENQRFFIRIFWNKKIVLFQPEIVENKIEKKISK